MNGWPGVTRVDAPDKPGMRSGRNLAVLVTALSRIPPEQFGKAVFAPGHAWHSFSAFAGSSACMAQAANSTNRRSAR